MDDTELRNDLKELCARHNIVFCACAVLPSRGHAVASINDLRVMIGDRMTTHLSAEATEALRRGIDDKVQAALAEEMERFDASN